MKIINRIIAWILFIGACTGLVFSAYGAVVYKNYEKYILNDVITSMDLVSQTLTTTSDGLSLVNDAVEKARDDIELMVTLTYDISDAIGNTELTLGSVSDLFGEDLIIIVEETRGSLVAVETSAILIDDTLNIISAIPLIGARYAPSQPLGESVAQISTALEDLPQSLSDIQEGLDKTAEDLTEIETTVDDFAERINEIDSTLENASNVIIDYQEIAAGLQDNLSHLMKVVPEWFQRISIGISILFSWVAIASLGLFSVGTLMLRQTKEEKVNKT